MQQSVCFQIKLWGGSLQMFLDANKFRMGLQIVSTSDECHSNLLDNAVKYSKSNPPEITIRTSNIKDNLTIEIEDKGIAQASTWISCFKSFTGSPPEMYTMSKDLELVFTM
ncbi:MAG: ATP-binding protein [Saprospiraceae bacterium]|nr:ATP-binding protein [Candidatus Vicinibacter affinis]